MSRILFFLISFIIESKIRTNSFFFIKDFLSLWNLKRSKLFLIIIDGLTYISRIQMMGLWRTLTLYRQINVKNTYFIFKFVFFTLEICMNLPVCVKPSELNILTLFIFHSPAMLKNPVTWTNRNVICSRQGKAKVIL